MPRITDRDEIRSLLETDRGWSVYALGDLSPGLFEQCEWFRAPDHPALALLFRGFGIPVLFTLGEAQAIGLILEEIGGAREMYLSVRPEILPLLKARYAVQQATAMWRMILDGTEYRPSSYIAAPPFTCSHATIPLTPSISDMIITRIQHPLPSRSQDPRRTRRPPS